MQDEDLGIEYEDESRQRLLRGHNTDDTESTLEFGVNPSMQDEDVGAASTSAASKARPLPKRVQTEAEERQFGAPRKCAQCHAPVKRPLAHVEKALAEVKQQQKEALAEVKTQIDQMKRRDAEMKVRIKSLQRQEKKEMLADNSLQKRGARRRRRERRREWRLAACPSDEGEASRSRPPKKLTSLISIAIVGVLCHFGYKP